MTEYWADRETADFVCRFVADRFPGIGWPEVAIIARLTDKTLKQGAREVVGQARKLSDFEVHLYTREEPNLLEFVSEDWFQGRRGFLLLLLNKIWWSALTEGQKKAALEVQLRSVETKRDDGEIKIKISDCRSLFDPVVAALYPEYRTTIDDAIRRGEELAKACQLDLPYWERKDNQKPEKAVLVVADDVESDDGDDDDEMEEAA